MSFTKQAKLTNGTASASFTSDIIFTYCEPCPGKRRAAVEDPEEGAEGSGGGGELWFAVAGVSAMAIFVWFSRAAALRSKKVWMAFLALAAGLCQGCWRFGFGV